MFCGAPLRQGCAPAGPPAAPLPPLPPLPAPGPLMRRSLAPAAPFGAGWKNPSTAGILYRPCRPAPPARRGALVAPPLPAPGPLMRRSLAPFQAPLFGVWSLLTKGGAYPPQKKEWISRHDY